MISRSRHQATGEITVRISNVRPFWHNICGYLENPFDSLNPFDPRPSILDLIKKKFLFVLYNYNFCIINIITFGKLGVKMGIMSTLTLNGYFDLI